MVGGSARDLSSWTRNTLGPEQLLKYMADRTLLEDWLRAHRLLVEKESAFTEVALRFEAGEISSEELEEERQALMAMRALCTAGYQKAVPEPAGARSGNGASSVLPYIAQGEQEKARRVEPRGEDDDNAKGDENNGNTPG